MAIDPRHIGVTSEPRTVHVEKRQLLAFAKATGESDPLYFDEETALSLGHPAIPAPPTFLFALQLGAPARTGDLFDPKNGLGIDVRRVLHAEQSFTYHRPVHAGDRLTLTTRTTDVYSKKNGMLDFVAQDTEARNEQGELCARMRVLTAVQNG